MNGQSAHQPWPGESESLDAAARRLQEETEAAVRHLREQVSRWSAPSRPEPAGTEDDGNR